MHGVVSADGRLNVALAEQGAGLVYAFEPMVQEQLRSGTIQAPVEATGVDDVVACVCMNAAEPFAQSASDNLVRTYGQTA